MTEVDIHYEDTDILKINGNNAVLDARTDIMGMPADWTQLSGSPLVWQKSYAGLAERNLILVDNVEPRLMASSAAACHELGDWHLAGGVLSIFCIGNPAQTLTDLHNISDEDGFVTKSVFAEDLTLIGHRHCFKTSGKAALSNITANAIGRQFWSIDADQDCRCYAYDLNVSNVLGGSFDSGSHGINIRSEGSSLYEVCVELVDCTIDHVGEDCIQVKQVLPDSELRVCNIKRGGSFYSRGNVQENSFLDLKAGRAIIGKRGLPVYARSAGYGSDLITVQGEAKSLEILSAVLNQFSNDSAAGCIHIQERQPQLHVKDLYSFSNTRRNLHFTASGSDHHIQNSHLVTRRDGAMANNDAVCYVKAGSLTGHNCTFADFSGGDASRALLVGRQEVELLSLSHDNVEENGHYIASLSENNLGRHLSDRVMLEFKGTGSEAGWSGVVPFWQTTSDGDASSGNCAISASGNPNAIPDLNNVTVSTLGQVRYFKNCVFYSRKTPVELVSLDCLQGHIQNCVYAMQAGALEPVVIIGSANFTAAQVLAHPGDGGLYDYTDGRMGGPDNFVQTGVTPEQFFEFHDVDKITISNGFAMLDAPADLLCFGSCALLEDVSDDVRGWFEVIDAYVDSTGAGCYRFRVAPYVANQVLSGGRLTKLEPKNKAAKAFL